jgi:hypothetical protein
MPSSFRFGERYELVIDDSTTMARLYKLIRDHEAAHGSGSSEQPDEATCTYRCHKCTDATYRKLSPLEAEAWSFGLTLAAPSPSESLCAEWMPEGLESTGSDAMAASVDPQRSDPVAPPAPPPPPLVGSPYFVKEGDLILYRAATEALKILSKEERAALEQEVRCAAWVAFVVPRLRNQMLRVALHLQRSEMSKTKSTMAYRSAHRL